MSWLFRKKNNLKAVYDDDLVNYLKSVGLYDAISSGSHLCKYCGKPITTDSLEVIVPKKDGPIFVCNNKNCLNQM